MNSKIVFTTLTFILIVISIYSIYSIKNHSGYDDTNTAFTNEIATSPDYNILINIQAQEGSNPAVAIYETANQEKMGIVEYSLEETHVMEVPKVDEISVLVMEGKHKTLLGAHIPKLIMEDMSISSVSYFNEEEGQTYDLPISENGFFYFFHSIDKGQNQFEFSFLDENNIELFKVDKQVNE